MEKESANGSLAVTKSPNSSVKRRGPPQSSIDTFAVQCKKCSKWRTVATEEEFEKYRSKHSEDPFVCSKRKGVRCDTPSDIEYDASRTWVMDKPNTPVTPKGFRRVAVLRKDYSKMDVQYITPDGTRIRAAPGIATYLKEHPEYSHLSASDFCFVAPKVMSDTVPKHSAGNCVKKYKRST